LVHRERADYFRFDNTNPGLAARLLSRDEARFPPPWTIEDIGACFIVKDKNGQALAYVYFGGQPAHPRRGQADRGKHR
jgi:hypothetical protein